MANGPLSMKLPSVLFADIHRPPALARGLESGESGLHDCGFFCGDFEIFPFRYELGGEVISPIRRIILAFGQEFVMFRHKILLFVEIRTIHPVGRAAHLVGWINNFTG
jgi:hypothetical protein